MNPECILVGLALDARNSHFKLMIKPQLISVTYFVEISTQSKKNIFWFVAEIVFATKLFSTEVLPSATLKIEQIKRQVKKKLFRLI